MKKFAVQIIGLVILIFFGAYISFNPGKLEQNLPRNPVPQKLQINDLVINVEIADTPAKKSKGLSEKTSIASDSGMLFLYDKSDIYQYWMKGMKIPIDIIWVNDDQIVDVSKTVLPPEPNTPDNALIIYKPIQPVNKVLEVQSGFFERNNLAVGDKIKIDF